MSRGRGPRGGPPLPEGAPEGANVVYGALPDGGKERLWFKNDRLDLVVWVEEKPHITRFQITYYEWTELEKYQRRLQQHVLTYDRKTGLKASYVPDESSAFPTPKVLVPEDCRECCKRLALEIHNDSSGIPDYVAQFVVQTLATDDLPCP